MDATEISGILANGQLESLREIGMVEPRLILHGGAGRAFKSDDRKPRVRESLHRIGRELWKKLVAGGAAMDVVEHGCRLLEDDVNFNAGTGSVLQSDGQIRMSAALMNGAETSFSGVINVQRIRNPIAIARRLQDERDRVLNGEGAAILARELGLEVWDPIVEKRLFEWIEERRGNFDIEHAGLVAEPELDAEHEDGTGTIGVVVRDRGGTICAGTSTGGRGFERIGRVSDSATPAGNYATAEAGVSCTGVGEDILDESLASRIVVRVADGASLHGAMSRSIEEGVARSRRFGAIAVSADGAVVWGKTTELLLAAYHDGSVIRDTLEAATTVAVQRVSS